MSAPDSKATPLREGDPENGRAALSIEPDLRKVAAAAQGEVSSSAALHVSLFAVCVLTRALHPLAVKAAVDPVTQKAQHEAVSVSVAECLLTLIVGQCMVLGVGGVRQWREIWRWAPMRVFSAVGCVYAFGDFLELASLGSLSGPTYQAVCQSKLIVTALLLRCISGKKQTGFQWVLLVLLVCSLVCYMTMKDLMLQPHRDQTEADTFASTMGLVFAVLKVFVSCLCAVLAGKYMNEYSADPVYMQLVRFKVSWLFTLLAIGLFRGDVWRLGMFHDWNQSTGYAATSYVVTTWSTMYLLALLDPILKNLGEACSVLVTYFMVSFHPGTSDVYENETFIALFVVFLAVVAYLLSKDVVRKAELHDALEAAKTRRP